MEIKRLHVGPRLSEAAIHNGVVYLAGQIAEDTKQNIDGQTREVLGHVERLLAEAGSDKNRILMCQVYLADIKDAAAMNEVWDAWAPPGNAPPRATMQTLLTRPELHIEVVVTAAVA